MTTRAKFRVNKVQKPDALDQPGARVFVQFTAVTDAPYDADGKSEDNDFARWTPTGVLEMTITNPNLFDAFKEGDKFYLDLTPAAA